MTPQELQNLLDELEASCASRRRAWENLQELRWVVKDATGVELPPPARKTIDLEGRLVKDGFARRCGIASWLWPNWSMLSGTSGRSRTASR
jgi:hypothetical protein